jgi:hypothetical protein
MKNQCIIPVTAEADSLDDNCMNYSQQSYNSKHEERETEESLLEFILRDAYELHKLKKRLTYASLNEVEKLKQHLIGSKKVCNLLKISERTLITWRKKSIIPFIKIGKNAYYNPHEIEAKLKQNYRRKSK